MIWLWCLGFGVSYVCKISVSMVKWSEVNLACAVHLCCTLKLFEYSSVHCCVCPNLGTAFTYNGINKNLWFTGAALKPCKAWDNNNQRNLRCQIVSPWHELHIMLAWALTIMTCTFEATSLNFREDVIWSDWFFCDSPHYLQINTLKYIMTALCHVP